MLVVVALLGIAAGTRRVSSFFAAGRLIHPVYNGMAVAVSLFAVLAFVGAATVSPLQPKTALLIVLGGVGGLLLAALLIAPYFRKFGGVTVPDFFGERFGTTARFLAVLVVIAVSFPALVLSLSALGTLAAQAVNLDFQRGIAVGVAVLLASTLFGGMRGLSAVLILHYAVLLVVSIAVLGIGLLQEGSAAVGASGTRLPGLISTLGLAGFAPDDPVNQAALIFCLVAGTAVFPHVLMRASTTPSADDARWSFFWAIPLVAALLALAPAYALVGNFRPASALYPGLIILGAITALLAVASGLLLAIGNALSYDVVYRSLYSTATPAIRLFAARGVLVAVVALAGFASLQGSSEIVAMTPAALSVAASGLLPGLLLGIWWKRANAAGAVAGMVVGIVVSLSYFLLPRYFPITFYEMSSLLFASGDDIARYDTLKEAYALAGGLAREAARAAWEEELLARTHWWGVKNVFAGAFAVPASLLVMILVSFATKRPSADMQAFVAALRRPDAISDPADPA